MVGVVCGIMDVDKIEFEKGCDCMKKLIVVVLTWIFAITMYGCGNDSIKSINTIRGNIRTYSEMSDGTWQSEGRTYKYKLEINGRMNNAVKDSTFVYLSNVENIRFDQAWKAAGLSSYSGAYFDVKDAVLVEVK